MSNVHYPSFFDAPTPGIPSESLGETYTATRNTLDCDQSNYSSCIVFSHIPTELGQTGISTIWSADPENPILEPNTE